MITILYLFPARARLSLQQNNIKPNIMLVYTNVFSSYSVNDLSKAKEFYGKILGFPVRETPEGLSVEVTKDSRVFLYQKPNHQPASFTVLNLQVMSVDAAVDALTGSGVKFEQYTGEIATDEKGIMHGGPGKGPTIAWFADPAGNILSVVENPPVLPVGTNTQTTAAHA